ncbi:MAG: helix-turn-helix transcriptional regulator [Oscillospiraceae bacterium]
MNFLAKVDFLMKSKKLNKHTLSIECNIPYTTIDGWYKKGYEAAKLSTAKKLADYFETTIDYLVRDDINDVDFGKKKLTTENGSELDDCEQILINTYRDMTPKGQKVLLDTAETLHENFKKDDCALIKKE